MFKTQVLDPNDPRISQGDYQNSNAPSSFGVANQAGFLQLLQSALGRMPTAEQFAESRNASPMQAYGGVQSWDADMLPKPTGPAELPPGNYWQGPLITQAPNVTPTTAPSPVQQPSQQGPINRRVVPTQQPKAYLSAVGNRIPITHNRSGASADHLSVGQRQRYERIQNLYGRERAMDAKYKMLNHNARILNRQQNG